MWAAGAGVNTSAKGPFNEPTNGYFFSWFAFAASIYYAYSVFVGDREGTYSAADTNNSDTPSIPEPKVGTGGGYQSIPDNNTSGEPWPTA